MQIRPMRWLFAALALLCWPSLSDEIVYPVAPANVPYATVSALPYAQGQKHTYGDDPLQYLLHWPAGPSEPSAVVVFIHGGCWLNAYDVKHSRALTSALAQRGFDTWSIEYRRTGDTGGGWPGSLHDVLAAIRWVIAQQPDETPIWLAGHSAGGHLALLAGAQFPLLTGVVGLAAITDITEYARGDNSCEKATLTFMGGMPAQRPDAYTLANPAQQPLHHNTQLLHGSDDAIVALNQSQLPGVTTRIQPDAGHFDWLHPGTRAFELLLTSLENSE